MLYQHQEKLQTGWGKMLLLLMNIEKEKEEQKCLGEIVLQLMHIRMRLTTLKEDLERIVEITIIQEVVHNKSKEKVLNDFLFFYITSYYIEKY